MSAGYVGSTRAECRGPGRPTRPSNSHNRPQARGKAAPRRVGASLFSNPMAARVPPPRRGNNSSRQSEPKSAESTPRGRLIQPDNRRTNRSAARVSTAPQRPESATSCEGRLTPRPRRNRLGAIKPMKPNGPANWMARAVKALASSRLMTLTPAGGRPRPRIWPSPSRDRSSGRRSSQTSSKAKGSSGAAISR